MENIYTPVNVNRLEELLLEIQYPAEKTAFLIDSFRNGFDLGYDGPMNRQDYSNNLPFKVGNKQQLLSKLMKEVEAKRNSGSI